MKLTAAFIILFAGTLQPSKSAVSRSAAGAKEGEVALALSRRDGGSSCELNSPEYEQRTDALSCQDDYVKAVEEEIERSKCKNRLYQEGDYDVDYNSSYTACDFPRDERSGDIPLCPENCSLRQFYYLYCTYLGEQTAEIGSQCGQPWEGASYCGFYNGDFCLMRYYATVLLTDTCSNADSSSGNELQCSDECMKAVTNYKEELGCCVAYWRGGVGGSGSGDEGPTVEEIFSACGVEVPSACTSFSPPSEFLDCARDPGVVLTVLH